MAVTPLPPPDYDWETNGGTSAAEVVSCVSLGCCCAVAACLDHLGLRSAAYPFDWNRQTMQGVIHFIRTGFADFMKFHYVKPFEGGKDTGGKAYCGAHHSVWHENLAILDGTSKYQRRIQRFFQNQAPRMLFIRVINQHTEMLEATVLLSVLQATFPKAEVYLLLIAVCQPVPLSFVVTGTDGRLLVHFVNQWPHDVLVYEEAILFGHYHASGAAAAAAAAAAAGGGAAAAGASLMTKSCIELMSWMCPFFGGPPQHVPFNPSPVLWIAPSPNTRPLQAVWQVPEKSPKTCPGLPPPCHESLFLQVE